MISVIIVIIYYISTCIIGLDQIFCLRFEGGKGGAAWETALLQLTTHVYASHAELADAMLCMLWDMFDSWGLAGESQAPGNQDDSMAGVYSMVCSR